MIVSRNQVKAFRLVQERTNSQMERRESHHHQLTLVNKYDPICHDNVVDDLIKLRTNFHKFFFFLDNEGKIDLGICGGQKT